MSIQAPHSGVGKPAACHRDHKQRLNVVMALSGMALALSNQASTAEDIRWLGGALGHEESWNFAGNWSTNAEPLSVDAVVIGAGLDVVIPHDAVALTLMLNGGLRLERDGKLTVGRGIIHSGPGYFINDGEITSDIFNDGYIASSFRVFGDLTNDENGGVVNQGLLHDRGPAIWTGDVLINTGQIFNSAAQWNGTLRNGAGGYIHNYDNSMWSGAVLGNADGGFVHNADTSTWLGDVVDNKGTILNDGRAEAAGSPHWIGNVVSNGGSILNKNASWEGAIGNNSNYIENTDSSSWTGEIASNTGSIFNINSVWNGDILSNSNFVGNLDPLSVWNGDILDNAGTISSVGVWNGSITSSGILKLGNRVNGKVQNSGTLQVRGDLAGITLLSNTGILDMTLTNTADTLRALSASFGDAAVYKVDIDAAGTSDQVQLDGVATLGGTVMVSAAPGTYANRASYRILSASSLVGSFAGVTTDLAFMAPRLSYSDTDVNLVLVRNDQGFATVGVTESQKQVAEALEALGAGNALYDAALWLTQPDAEHAFSRLSGEFYSASDASAIQNSRLVRDIALDRVRQLLGATHASQTAADQSDPESLPGSLGFWTQFYGATSDASTGLNAVSQSYTGGVSVGIDGSAGDWYLGLMLHGGKTSTSIPTLSSTVFGDDYGVGLYGGSSWGNTKLSLGADYTSHRLQSERIVAFPGFADALSASYNANTAQVFGEVSQAFQHGATALVPYFRAAYLGRVTDGLSENGGAAALTRADSFLAGTFTTLGLRGEHEAVLGDEALLTASASIGWQHAIVAPASQNNSIAGVAFEVAETPAASDSLVAGAELNLATSAAADFNLSYGGQFSPTANSHSLHVAWSVHY